MDELNANLREAIEGWLAVEEDQAEYGASDKVVEVAI